MNKTIKLISALLIVLLVVAMPNAVFADNTEATEEETSDVGKIISSVEPDLTQAQTDGSAIKDLAVKVTSILQYVAIIGGVIILAILGIKYMMGSVEEKAEYKKSFIPLVVGVIVVMGATTIATFLFNTFTL